MEAQDQQNSFWQQSGQMALWTALDLNLKKHEILLNGYTTLGDSTHFFLEIIKNQKAGEMSLPTNFPYNTHSFQHIYISNYSSFSKIWQNYMPNSLGSFDIAAIIAI